MECGLIGIKSKICLAPEVNIWCTTSGNYLGRKGRATMFTNTLYGVRANIESCCGIEAKKYLLRLSQVIGGEVVEVTLPADQVDPSTEDFNQTLTTWRLVGAEDMNRLIAERREIKQYPIGQLWPVGPWSNQPDSEVFDHAGLTCMVRKHPVYLHMQGYVGVPTGHPLFGNEDFQMAEDDEGFREEITYHGHLDEDRGVWWFGVDGAHNGQSTVWDYRDKFLDKTKYLGVEEVKATLRSIADELAQVQVAQ